LTYPIDQASAQSARDSVLVAGFVVAALPSVNATRSLVPRLPLTMS
jgi:hypothetical protein